ncbi:MAG: starch-binding protein [Ruminococcus sp.]|nr:starch-binding protein [Ruminococcus sp.]
MSLLKNGGQSAVAVLLVMLLVVSSSIFALSVNAANETSLEYTFTGNDKEKAGYAEGTVKLTVESDGNYNLYWADDNGALNGYSSIKLESCTAGKSYDVPFGNHTVIPKGATRMIALNGSGIQVAQYVLPENKRLKAGKRLYTFNSYSDIHIDKDKNGVFYTKASRRWADALSYGVKMNTDFIVSSGDSVTNAAGPDDEWEEYERLLSKSDYVNPVWESDGNHETRSGQTHGIEAFVRATGTDSTAANFDANKPYYYMVEEKTGDIFIFMALEKKGSPAEVDELSTAQMNWVENLVEKNYDKGVNIYIVEHSPIDGFGAGDRMSNPYYKAHLSEQFNSTVRFKNLLKNYPKLIFMSGHTHLDFTEGYNYSNENNTACHMIHNPSVAGTTTCKSDGTLEYRKGEGLNSQGYYVEVYDNEIIYYGANLTDQLIYPQYSYIMEGVRSNNDEETTTAEVSSETTASESYEASSENESTNTTASETTEEASSTSASTSAPEETTEATEETTQKPTEKDKYEVGDVNMDELISVKDATLIQKALAKITTLSAEQEKLADTDFNGDVNIKDATRIQKYVAKLIDSFYSDTQKKDKITSGSGTFTEELAKVKQVLTGYYSFASYDQYQALKKYYYAYKNASSVDNESEVIAQFESKINALITIAEHIGVTNINKIGDTYYFENTNGWSEVYAYAWTGSSHNAEWPGVKLSKVGTNYGHDVYRIKFDSEAQYSSIIFSGGKDKPQTVNISLEQYSGNCFYLDGKTTDGKLNVGNFTYNSGDTPVSGDKYAMYYYTANHPWGYDSGKVFTDNGNGTYSFEYTAADSNNLSFNVYNTKTSTYNCVADSQSVTYSAKMKAATA